MEPTAVFSQVLVEALDAAPALVLLLALVSVEAEQGKHCDDLE
ncbi:hypothetical protein P9J64_06320 [Deltaproteobacteria bacterium IMCC39524]|nr:hypothetical protein [Deltaproteobacteria bacterium IMCC39524]